MPRRARLALIAAAGLALGLALVGRAGAPPATGTFSRFPLSAPDPLFGGLSALEILDDGREAILLSDHGSWTRARITRDAGGQILAVEPAPMQLLRGYGEAPLPHRATDSEALAIGPDGRVHVAFEGQARVLRYETLDGRAVGLPVHPDFRLFGVNSGFEALAVDAEGTLYAIPERSGAAARPFPVYRYRAGARGWEKPFTIPRRDDFLVVGADIGPDGRLYILERRFRGVFGFASRVRRFVIEADRLTGEEQLFETRTGTFGNLEGLSVWRDAGGQLVLSMVSDDNFLSVLPNELVEYRPAD